MSPEGDRLHQLGAHTSGDERGDEHVRVEDQPHDAEPQK